MLRYIEVPLIRRAVRNWLKLPLAERILKCALSPFYGLLGLLGLIPILFLSPFFKVRVGRISSERIGHFILEYDWYFSCIRAKNNKKYQTCLDIFFYKGEICNSFLDNLWRRNALVMPRILIYPLYAWLRVMPGLSSFLVPLPTRPTNFGVLDGLPPSIKLSKKESEYGARLLQSLGVDSYSKLACLYVRDSAYVESLGVEPRHTSYRDSTIENYLPLIMTLIARGYFVFRMGTVAKGQVEVDSPMYFDYVNSDIRSDFLDFYIASKSIVAISTDSGMMQFPIAFRKPLGIVNVPAFHGLIWGQSLTLFQFKTFVDFTSHRELNLKELRARSFESVDNLESFLAIGITHLENSPLELANFGAELVDFLENPLRREKEYTNIKEAFKRAAELDSSSAHVPRLSLSWIENHPSFLLDS